MSARQPGSKARPDKDFFSKYTGDLPVVFLVADGLLPKVKRGRYHKYLFSSHHSHSQPACLSQSIASTTRRHLVYEDKIYFPVLAYLAQMRLRLATGNSQIYFKVLIRRSRALKVPFRRIPVVFEALEISLVTFVGG